ncbi:hypothetical protein [Actinomadura welshii]|uniref:hypothetical protein n=1 Tax=Actinomadura welshii TaxID=3103817 RepID=UPI0004632F07|nr:hypothetical protein [Actinomadura madurae]
MSGTAAQTGWTWAQTAIVLAAAIAIVGAAITAVLNHGFNQRAVRREQRARTFAEALSAVEDYAELPYRVRRRSGNADARLQLTEDISKIQSRIAFYQAWLRIEAPQVATAYEKLVRSAKRQAGGQMSQAWAQRVRVKDRQMNLRVAYPRDEIDKEIANCVTLMRRTLGNR